MRIPTSVIVMSLVTATPFGLAIRDTLKKKPAADLEDYTLDDYERSTRRDRERLAEYEAEAAREAAERAKEATAKLVELDTVFGKQRASLGSLFTGAQIGSPASAPLQDKLDQVTSEGFIVASYEIDDESAVRSLHVELESSYDTTVDPCEALRDKLVTAWGPSSSGVWTEPSTHMRASLTRGRSCRLSFDHYLEPADWLAALPLDAVGQKAEKVAKVVRGDIYDGTLDWSLPGTGAGFERSTAMAYIDDHDKVVYVSISTDTDFDSLVAIRNALTAKLKVEPTRDDDSGGWVWKKKPGFQLTQSYDGNRFTLAFGKDPYQ